MALGFFLQCNGDSPDPWWSCKASAVLRVHSQTEGIDDISRVFTQTFNSKENEWGYPQFMAFDTLADPANGFIKNDTIKLSVQVWADAPQHMSD
uniref:MATH domain-containing protein n=1 Tax=Acrobeloides nanus TaxID=290746 RepID=A0A914DBL1_9BILA